MAESCNENRLIFSRDFDKKISTKIRKKRYVLKKKADWNLEESVPNSDQQLPTEIQHDDKITMIQLNDNSVPSVLEENKQTNANLIQQENDLNDQIRSEDQCSVRRVILPPSRNKGRRPPQRNSRIRNNRGYRPRCNVTTQIHFEPREAMPEVQDTTEQISKLDLVETKVDIVETPPMRQQSRTIRQIGYGLYQFLKKNYSKIYRKIRDTAPSLCGLMYNEQQSSLTITAMQTEIEQAASMLKYHVLRCKRKLHSSSTTTENLYQGNNVLRVQPGCLVSDVFFPNEPWMLTLEAEYTKDIKKAIKPALSYYKNGTSHFLFDNKPGIENAKSYLQEHSINGYTDFSPAIGLDELHIYVNFLVPTRARRDFVFSELSEFGEISILNPKYGKTFNEYSILYKNPRSRANLMESYGEWATTNFGPSEASKIQEQPPSYHLPIPLLTIDTNVLKKELGEIYSLWPDCFIKLEKSSWQIFIEESPPPQKVAQRINILCQSESVLVPMILIKPNEDFSVKLKLGTQLYSWAAWQTELKVRAEYCKETTSITIWGLPFDRRVARELVIEEIQRQLQIISHNNANIAHSTAWLVCAQSMNGPDTIQLTTWGHVLHVDCLIEQITGCIRNKPLPLLPLKCGYCAELIVYDDWIAVASPSLLTQMYKASVLFYVAGQGSEAYRHCQNPYCSCIYAIEDIQEGIITCQACEKTFCSYCNAFTDDIIHDTTCVKTKASIDNDTRTWVRENAVTCPNCKVSFEKGGGCNHMHCIRCNRDFCALCGQFVNPQSYMDHYTNPNTPCYQKLLADRSANDDSTPA